MGHFPGPADILPSQVSSSSERFHRHDVIPAPLTCAVSLQLTRPFAIRLQLFNLPPLERADPHLNLCPIHISPPVTTLSFGCFSHPRRVDIFPFKGRHPYDPYSSLVGLPLSSSRLLPGPFLLPFISFPLRPRLHLVFFTYHPLLYSKCLVPYILAWAPVESTRIKQVKSQLKTCKKLES